MALAQPEENNMSKRVFDRDNMIVVSKEESKLPFDFGIPYSKDFEEELFVFFDIDGQNVTILIYEEVYPACSMIGKMMLLYDRFPSIPKYLLDNRDTFYKHFRKEITDKEIKGMLVPYKNEV